MALRNRERHNDLNRPSKHRADESMGDCALPQNSLKVGETCRIRESIPIPRFDKEGPEEEPVRNKTSGKNNPICVIASTQQTGSLIIQTLSNFKSWLIAHKKTAIGVGTGLAALAIIHLLTPGTEVASAHNVKISVSETTPLVAGALGSTFFKKLPYERFEKIINSSVKSVRAFLTIMAVIGIFGFAVTKYANSVARSPVIKPVVSPQSMKLPKDQRTHSQKPSFVRHVTREEMKEKASLPPEQQKFEEPPYSRLSMPLHPLEANKHLRNMSDMTLFEKMANTLRQLPNGVSYSGRLKDVFNEVKRRNALERCKILIEESYEDGNALTKRLDNASKELLSEEYAKSLSDTTLIEDLGKELEKGANVGDPRRKALLSEVLRRNIVDSGKDELLRKYPNNPEVVERYNVLFGL